MDAVVSFLFKYPSRVWARGDVVWSPVVPVWLVIVLAVVALAVAAVAYARVRGVPRLERGTMFALRTLALLIVVACLLRPTLVVASAVPQRNMLAILLDDSRSMQVSDVGDSTRAAAVARVCTDCASPDRRERGAQCA